MPQNQPNPKEAVSIMEGASSSMAGIAGGSILDVDARFTLLSLASDAWFGCIVISKQPPDKTEITPHTNRYRLSFLFPLIFIQEILSLRSYQALMTVLNTNEWQSIYL
jgi:hypothetical protein